MNPLEKRSNPGWFLPEHPLRSLLQAVSGKEGLSSRDRSLARDAVLNVGGEVVPLAVAFVAMPFLIARLGTPRFGILTVLWAIFGNLAGLDLGLGVAVTKVTAEKLARGKYRDVPVLFWTALASVLTFGVLLALVLVSVAPWLMTRMPQVPYHLQRESIGALMILAGGVPLVLSLNLLRGFLGAFRRFDVINFVRAAGAVLYYGGPMIASMYRPSLVVVSAAMVLARGVVWVVWLVYAIKLLPTRPRRCVRRNDIAKSIFSFAGWLAVYNLGSTLLFYGDRVLTAAMLPISAVAWYGTAQEIATRLWTIPGAVIPVLIPAFAGQLTQDKRRAVAVLNRSTMALLFLLTVPILASLVFARPLLSLWLGAKVAENVAGPFQCFTIAILLVYAASGPSFAFVQAANRPDLLAKVRLAVLCGYIPLLWALIHAAGLWGAVCATACRFVLEAIAWFVTADLLARQS